MKTFLIALSFVISGALTLIANASGKSEDVSAQVEMKVEMKDVPKSVIIEKPVKKKKDGPKEVPPLEYFQENPSPLVVHAVTSAMNSTGFSLKSFYEGAYLSMDDIGAINKIIGTPDLEFGSSYSLLNTGSLIVSELNHAGGYPNVRTDLRNHTHEPTFDQMATILQDSDPTREASHQEIYSMFTGVHALIHKILGENLLGQDPAPYIKLFIQRVTAPLLKSENKVLQTDGYFKTLAAIIFCLQELNTEMTKETAHYQSIVLADQGELESVIDAMLDDGVFEVELFNAVWDICTNIDRRMRTIAEHQFDIGLLQKAWITDELSHKVSGSYFKLDSKTPIKWNALYEILPWIPLSQNPISFLRGTYNGKPVTFKERQIPEDGSCGLHSLYGMPEEWNTFPESQTERRKDIREDAADRLIEAVSLDLPKETLSPGDKTAEEYRQILSKQIREEFKENPFTEEEFFRLLSSMTTLDPNVSVPSKDKRFNKLRILPGFTFDEVAFSTILELVTVENFTLDTKTIYDTLRKLNMIPDFLLDRIRLTKRYFSKSDKEADELLDTYSCRKDVAIDYIERNIRPAGRWMNFGAMDLLADILEHTKANLRIGVKNAPERRLDVLGNADLGYPVRTNRTRTLFVLNSHGFSHYTLLEPIVTFPEYKPE